LTKTQNPLKIATPPKNNLAKYKTKLDSVKNGQDRESSARRQVPPQASPSTKKFRCSATHPHFWSRPSGTIFAGTAAQPAAEPSAEPAWPAAAGGLQRSGWGRQMQTICCLSSGIWATTQEAPTPRSSGLGHLADRIHCWPEHRVLKRRLVTIAQVGDYCRGCKGAALVLHLASVGQCARSSRPGRSAGLPSNVSHAVVQHSL
jgi:hypothetical protein